jgi:hypothetical protein
VAAAIAAPPLLPPHVRCGLQGLRLMPSSGLSVTPFQPNSHIAVLPRTIAPASFKRATAGASSVAATSEVVSEPLRVGMPMVSHKSLTVTGTPSSVPCGPPLIHLASESRAADIARSPSTTRNAFSSGLRAAMTSRHARTTSTGDSVRARYARSSSAAPSSESAASAGTLSSSRRWLP